MLIVYLKKNILAATGLTIKYYYFTLGATLFTKNKRNQDSDVTDIYLSLSLKVTAREFATVNYLYSTTARASLQLSATAVRVCNRSAASSSALKFRHANLQREFATDQLLLRLLLRERAQGQDLYCCSTHVVQSVVCNGSTASSPASLSGCL